jgi:hypothetical protein
LAYNLKIADEFQKYIKMKALRKGMSLLAVAFISSMSIAQEQKQSETKKIEPVKVNEVAMSKKTHSQRKEKKLLRVERIQKAEKEEKE